MNVKSSSVEMASVQAQAQLPYSIPTPVKDISCQKLLRSKGVVMQGFLRKMPSAQKWRLFGTIRKAKWKSRYVIIANGCVYLFKDESSDGYRRAMSLFGFKDVKQDSHPSRKRIRWVFKVVDALEDKERERSLWFAARSKESMNQWIKYFKEEIVKACFGRFRPFGHPRLSSSSDNFDSPCSETTSSLSAISPQVTNCQWNKMKEKGGAGLASSAHSSSSSDDDYTEIIDDEDDDDSNEVFEKSSSDQSSNVPKVAPKVKPQTVVGNQKRLGLRHSSLSLTRNSSPSHFMSERVDPTCAKQEKKPVAARGSRLLPVDLRYPPVVPRPRSSDEGSKRRPVPPPPPPKPVVPSLENVVVSTGKAAPTLTMLPESPVLPPKAFPKRRSQSCTRKMKFTFPPELTSKSVDDLSAVDVDDEFQSNSLVKASYWAGCRDEGDRIMGGIKTDGVFMIRNATDGQDYKTLMVRCDGRTRKYKINKMTILEKEMYSLHLAEESFLTVGELLEFYQNNSVPNDQVRLTEPYSKVWNSNAEFHSPN